MRECWVNVYQLPSGRSVLGQNELTPDDAVSGLRRVRRAMGPLPAYRLHVRLKTEPAGRAAFEASLYRG